MKNKRSKTKWLDYLTLLLLWEKLSISMLFSIEKIILFQVSKKMWNLLKNQKNKQKKQFNFMLSHAYRIKRQNWILGGHPPPNPSLNYENGGLDPPAPGDPQDYSSPPHK